MAKAEKPKVATTSSNVPVAQNPAPVRLRNPFEDMDPLFERMLGRNWLRPFNWDWPLAGSLKGVMEARLPAVDIVDRDDEVVVRAEVPGIDKKDLDVSMTDNTVTIKGSTSREEKEEKGEYYRCEISRGAFTRTVTLPCNVDSSKVKATFKDGVLEIVLPKAAQAKRQTININ